MLILKRNKKFLEIFPKNIKSIYEESSFSRFLSISIAKRRFMLELWKRFQVDTCLSTLINFISKIYLINSSCDLICSEQGLEWFWFAIPHQKLLKRSTKDSSSPWLWGLLHITIWISQFMWMHLNAKEKEFFILEKWWKQKRKWNRKVYLFSS